MTPLSYRPAGILSLPPNPNKILSLKGWETLYSVSRTGYHSFVRSMHFAIKDTY